MIAHVIMLNDSVQGVVLDNEEKAKLCMATKRAHYFRQSGHAFADEEDYMLRCHWYIRSVEVTP